MYTIQILNAIAKRGLDCFAKEHYYLSEQANQPDAILLRSYDLHAYPIEASVTAVARAGAGTNNIPIDAMTQRGIPVFNTPGANANAVKELVLAGMLMASRNIHHAWDFVRQLEGDAENIEHQVEQQKKQFSGFELPNKTLGVIGLGSIGVQVANSAHLLDMRVTGFDPKLTVRNAWKLHASVQHADSIESVLSESDFISLHVPLNEHTRHMINKKRLTLMKANAVLMNFSREAIVDLDAVINALNSGKLHSYVCDFPHPDIIHHPRAICLPHLGASTTEAEENCAVMAAHQLQQYLEHGHISNAVNFPDVHLSREANTSRLAIINANVPSMVAKISEQLSNEGINIVDMINKSRGDIACTLIDIDREASPKLLASIQETHGILRVRQL